MRAVDIAGEIKTISCIYVQKKQTPVNFGPSLKP
jgi:hypothetical protein